MFSHTDPSSGRQELRCLIKRSTLNWMDLQIYIWDYIFVKSICNCDVWICLNLDHTFVKLRGGYAKVEDGKRRDGGGCINLPSRRTVSRPSPVPPCNNLLQSHTWNLTISNVNSPPEGRWRKKMLWGKKDLESFGCVEIWFGAILELRDLSRVLKFSHLRYRDNRSWDFEMKFNLSLTDFNETALDSYITWTTMSPTFSDPENIQINYNMYVVSGKYGKFTFECSSLILGIFVQTQNPIRALGTRSRPALGTSPGYWY